MSKQRHVYVSSGLCKWLVFDRSKVWEMKERGKSIRQICDALGMSHGTVQQALEARA